MAVHYFFIFHMRFHYINLKIHVKKFTDSSFACGVKTKIKVLEFWSQMMKTLIFNIKKCEILWTGLTQIKCLSWFTSKKSTFTLHIQSRAWPGVILLACWLDVAVFMLLCICTCCTAFAQQSPPKRCRHGNVIVRLLLISPKILALLTC